MPPLSFTVAIIVATFAYAVLQGYLVFLCACSLRKFHIDNACQCVTFGCLYSFNDFKGIIKIKSRVNICLLFGSGIEIQVLKHLVDSFS